ncbi:MAG: hypothetical protein LZF61_03580 [Nitrosomonas sp.]|nr:MAG: hypothetical protein LZF61_03580 [Nitrosomonas sp.]
MRVPDISLSISERRPVCVIDPALALTSREAPLTVLRLAKLFELWVPRAFWQILDSSDFIEQQPVDQAQKLIGYPQADCDQEQLREYCDTIKIWQSLRSRRDTAGLGLRWLGDKLEESLLGSDTDWEVIQRYEALAQSMLGRKSRVDSLSPISLEYATVDALILAAALGSRFLIARASANENAEPMCCQTMLASNVPIRCIHPSDSSILIRKEREQIQDLLAWGGAAAWTVTGTSIAIVQIMAPLVWEKTTAGLESMLSMDMPFAADAPEVRGEISYPDYWQDAVAFWYRLD